MINKYVTLILLVTLQQVNTQILGYSCDDTGRCIKSFKERKTWREAQLACETDQAHLVIIQDDQLNQFIKKAAKGFGFWIGLNNAGGASYSWIDGTPLGSFRPWVPNLVSRDRINGDACVFLIKSRFPRWNNGACNMKIPYICEKNQV